MHRSESWWKQWSHSVGNNFGVCKEAEVYIEEN